MLGGGAGEAFFCVCVCVCVLCWLLMGASIIPPSSSTECLGGQADVASLLISPSHTHHTHKRTSTHAPEQVMRMPPSTHICTSEGDEDAPPPKHKQHIPVKVM